MQHHQPQLRLVPSFDPDHEAFNPKRYWEGPVWPPLNWLIYRGLKSYAPELAQQVRTDFIELVQQYGFHEYFNPHLELPAGESAGYGANHFTWTASVILDLIQRP